jgi:hypothetical protein
MYLLIGDLLMFRFGIESDDIMKRYKQPHFLADTVEYKACAKCKEIKPLFLFNNDKSTHDGLACYCRNCNSINVNKWKSMHYDMVKANNKKWRANNSVRMDAYDKLWKQQNKDKAIMWSHRWRDNNKERSLESAREWKRNHPEEMALWSIKRRDAVRAATPSWADFRHIGLVYIVRDEMEMLYNEKFHVDHIIPLNGKNVSGLHVPWNLQIIPKLDNLRKYNNV